MLLGGGALAVFGSEKIGFEGAGPLGVVFAAFVSNYYWCQQGNSKLNFPFEIQSRKIYKKRQFY